MEDGLRCTLLIIKTLVRRVLLLWLTFGQLFLFSGTLIAFRALVFCCLLMAVIRLFTSSVTVLLVLTGRRRLFLFGLLSDITRKVKVLLALKRSGLFRKRNFTPSCNAFLYFLRYAGIFCSERR